MDRQPRLHPTTPGRAAVRPDPHDAAFAHASEAELARILDFYGVAWEYEPHTFPLMWNLRGEVVESFAPDFFLPELDLYVELTTLRQKLVRKKNRKLRRMRELYPDLRVKLLYGKDFRALLLKFGRIGFADALSGTVGQTTPPRGAERRDAADGDRAADPAAAHGASPGVAAADGTDPTPGAGARRAPRARRGTRRPETRRASGQQVEPAPGAPAAAEPAGRAAQARRRRDAE